MINIDYSFYLIADEALCPPDEIPRKIADVINHGVTCIQLRMKNSPKTKIAQIGHELLTLLRPKKIPLIINDHIDIAKAIDADGVHVGQTDQSSHQARALLGKNKIIGLSLSNSQEAIASSQYPVDYFGVGPIYPTTTKLDAAAPIAITGLQQIISLLDKPILAIGGINKNNLISVLNTSVAGVVIGSAVLSANDPIVATQELAQLIAKQRIKDE